jgi:hypothetical protein
MKSYKVKRFVSSNTEHLYLQAPVSDLATRHRASQPLQRIVGLSHETGDRTAENVGPTELHDDGVCSV